MNLGDLEESLLNAGKEKGQELADGALGEEAAAGGLMGAVAGFGKGMLDNAFGGGSGPQEAPESNEAGGAANVDDRADDNDSSDDSNDDDSNDDDDSDNNP